MMIRFFAWILRPIVIRIVREREREKLDPIELKPVPILDAVEVLRRKEEFMRTLEPIFGARL